MTPKAICPICGRPSLDGMTHPKCERALGLDGLISFFKYEGPIRKALLALKYQFAYDIAKEFARDMAHLLTSGFNPLPKKAILIPVPIYKDRENWRGFNQSEKIAKILAKELNLKFVPDLLIKKVRTKPQTELTRKARLRNLRNVFSINPNYTLDPKRYSLILFDDIWTTGTTLKEAAKVLKRKGARLVWGLTLARS